MKGFIQRLSLLIQGIALTIMGFGSVLIVGSFINSEIDGEEERAEQARRRAANIILQ